MTNRGCSCRYVISVVIKLFLRNICRYSFYSLRFPVRFSGERAYPLNLSSLQCTRKEIRAFAEEARQLGINYIGLCCGSSSFYLREVAEAYGKKPPSCKYAPDVRHTMVFGDLEQMSPLAKKIRTHLSGWE